MCIPFIGLAQTDYQLDFNASTLDYVEMPNTSSLIANSTTFSMSAWVYPQANPAAHSGIMGLGTIWMLIFTFYNYKTLLMLKLVLEILLEQILIF